MNVAGIGKSKGESVKHESVMRESADTKIQMDNMFLEHVVLDPSTNGEDRGAFRFPVAALLWS